MQLTLLLGSAGFRLPITRKKRRRLSDLTGRDKQASSIQKFQLLLRAKTQMNKHSCTMPDGSKAEHGSRPAGKPWFGYDMDWAFSKLWLLNIINDELMFATPNSSRYLHLSLIVENRFSTTVNACVPPFFFLWLSCRTEPILALSLPPEPCWSWWNPIISSLHLTSLSAPCAPSRPFIHLLPRHRNLWAL